MSTSTPLRLRCEHCGEPTANRALVACVRCGHVPPEPTAAPALPLPLPRPDDARPTVAPSTWAGLAILGLGAWVALKGLRLVLPADYEWLSFLAFGGLIVAATRYHKVYIQPAYRRTGAPSSAGLPASSHEPPKPQVVTEEAQQSVARAASRFRGRWLLVAGLAQVGLIVGVLGSVAEDPRLYVASGLFAALAAFLAVTALRRRRSEGAS